MTGTIKRTTANYTFRIPIFDAPGWGKEMERNMDIMDAVLFAATGLGNIKGQWENSTVYVVGERLSDPLGSLWVCEVDHTSAVLGTFAEDRAANPTYWTQITDTVTNRGAWTTATNYNTNDYVSDAYRVGIVTNKYVSDVSYDADVANGDIITLVDLTQTVSDANLFAQSASDSKDNAAISEANALASENAAATSETNAGTSEANALTYANTALSTYATLDGGTTGQVLLKATNTDFDFIWATLPGGGDMLKSVYDPTAKNLDVYDRANHTGAQAIATITNLQTTLDTKVDEAVQIIAGEGMTGGGALDASRTITLGAPSTLTGATLNDVTGTTHTHAISLNAGDVGAVPTTRSVIAGTGLTGGGALSADRTFNVVYGAAANTAAQGNDTRIVGALQRTGGTMTGFIVLHANPTSALHPATKSYVDTEIAGIPAPNYGTGNAALAFGGVGTYIMARKAVATAVAAGATIAGSSLDRASLLKSGTSDLQFYSDSVGLSGTWRNMGAAVTNSGDGSIFLRIS